MPAIDSEYRAPVFIPGGFLQTVIPGSFLKLKVPFERVRIDLSDGDFLDLDWLKLGRKKLIIGTHGLEGSSRSGYMLQLARQCIHSDFDLLAWNCRSCSGEMNRCKKLYHHADIEDIDQVFRYVLEMEAYEEFFLIGYSMGGCISIKYLAESALARKYISACAAISTPCDIGVATRALDDWQNRIFRTHFLFKLKSKLQDKIRRFPDEVPFDNLNDIRNWAEFDKKVIAPFNGYETPSDFYQDASANSYLDKLDTPTLLINAQNDPILQSGAIPVQSAFENPMISIELPLLGGHVYFPVNLQMRSYIPGRVLKFFRNTSEIV